MWAHSEQSQLKARRLKNTKATSVRVTDMDIKKITPPQKVSSQQKMQLNSSTICTAIGSFQSKFLVGQ